MVLIYCSRYKPNTFGSHSLYPRSYQLFCPQNSYIICPQSRWTCIPTVSKIIFLPIVLKLDLIETTYTHCMVWNKKPCVKLIRIELLIHLPNMIKHSWVFMFFHASTCFVSRRKLTHEVADIKVNEQTILKDNIWSRRRCAWQPCIGNMWKCCIS